MGDKAMEANDKNKTLTIKQSTGVTFSLIMLVMFAGAIATVFTWTADMRNRVTNAEGMVTILRADIVKLQNEGTDTKVKFTEIQTQLKSIDATLLDIKERL